MGDEVDSMPLTRREFLWGALALSASACSAPCRRPEPGATMWRRWAVAYGALDPEAARGLELLIVEPANFDSLVALRERTDAVLCGYVSVGEISVGDPDFATLEHTPAVLETTTHWGSRHVDLRSARWREHILARIGQLVASGYDGVMLDTIDTPLELERRDPGFYHGTTQMARALLEQLARTYPGLMVLLNGGYGLGDELPDAVDALVIESLFGGYDARTGAYRQARSSSERAEVIAWIERARRRRALPVFAIDYAEDTRSEEASARARALRQLGFSPYIARGELAQIQKQPR